MRFMPEPESQPDGPPPLAEPQDTTKAPAVQPGGTSAVPLLPSGPPDSSPPVQWSALRAALLGPFFPARTATMTQHMRLRTAFSIHVLCSVLLLAITWFEVGLRTRGLHWHALWNGTIEHLGWLIRKWEANPPRRTIEALGFVLLWEAAFLVVAFLAMPWGARNERLRESWRSARRQVWLRTSQLVVVFILMAAILHGVRETERRWMQGYPQQDREAWKKPTRPVPQPGEPLTENDWSDYGRAMGEFHVRHRQWVREVQAFVARRPWYVAQSHYVYWPIWMAAMLWISWSLIRAMSAPRTYRAVSRPPRCDSCGYNLTGLARDGRCPECGESIANSIGAARRVGPPWMQRGQVGWFGGWYRTAFRAVVSPTALGRVLPSNPSRLGAMRFVGVTLAVFLPFFVATILVMLASSPHWGSHAPRSDWVFNSMNWMILNSLLVLGLCSLSASVVGTLQSMETRRNMLPFAVQGAAYLAPLAAIAVLADFVVTSVLRMANVYKWSTEFALGVYGGRDVLRFARWSFVLGAALVFLVLLRRIIRAARFANR